MNEADRTAFVLSSVESCVRSIARGASLPVQELPLANDSDFIAKHWRVGNVTLWVCDEWYEFSTDPGDETRECGNIEVGTDAEGIWMSPEASYLGAFLQAHLSQQSPGAPRWSADDRVLGVGTDNGGLWKSPEASEPDAIHHAHLGQRTPSSLSWSAGDHMLAVSVVALTLALLPWPYAYYQMLRLTTVVTCILAFAEATHLGGTVRRYVLIPIGLLFAFVTMDREAWVVADLAAALVLGLVLGIGRAKRNSESRGR